jgi:hypothetical protein
MGNSNIGIFILIALVGVILYYVIIVRNRPSLSDILDAEKKSLGYFSIEPSDCKMLVAQKKDKIADLREAFELIKKNPTTYSKDELLEGCRQTRKEAEDMKTRIDELREATIQVYESSINVIKGHNDLQKLYKETRNDIDDEDAESREDVQDIMERAYEGAQAQLPELREKLADLGYTPKQD